jgi:hypothetical protein
MEPFKHNFKIVRYKDRVAFVHIPSFDILLPDSMRLNAQRGDKGGPFVNDIINHPGVQELKRTALPIKRREVDIRIKKAQMGVKMLVEFDLHHVLDGLLILLEGDLLRVS